MNDSEKLEFRVFSLKKMWWKCDESTVHWVACCESGCDG
jgi:hypothetical protein